MRSSLIWVCTVCSDLSVPIFKIITVGAENLQFYGDFIKNYLRIIIRNLLLEALSTWEEAKWIMIMKHDWYYYPWHNSWFKLYIVCLFWVFVLE